MYAQTAVKRNILPRNSAYRIVNRDVHFCTPPCSSLRSKNYTSLSRITLDTATEKMVMRLIHRLAVPALELTLVLGCRELQTMFWQLSVMVQLIIHQGMQETETD